MKYLDRVKVININNYYKEHGIYLNRIGTIMSGEIRFNTYYVIFNNEEGNKNWYDECEINIKDLEFVEDGKATDAMILEDLPKNDPRWWCKVEDGFILNLLGEKKNKIPYDYNS